MHSHNSLALKCRRDNVSRRLEWLPPRSNPNRSDAVPRDPLVQPPRDRFNLRKFRHQSRIQDASRQTSFRGSRGDRVATAWRPRGDGPLARPSAAQPRLVTSRSNSNLLVHDQIRYAREYTPAPPIIPVSQSIQQRSNQCVRPRGGLLAAIYSKWRTD
jgi:hypothetical protein